VPQPPNVGGRPAADTAQKAPPLDPQPICATIVGALYQDDRLLGVAHQFQASTDIHLKHPAM
jgi:Asp-tRNA(Asn)/Glu-tRNA(Gln) amidotransferase A subunit family amidase